MPLVGSLNIELDQRYMNNTDYSQYSKEELFEALGSIDYELYASNALNAYSILLTKFDVSDNEITKRYSGDSLIASIFKLCLFTLANNSSSSSTDLRNKIATIKIAHEEACS